jgi:hypothetical protein
MTHMARLGDPNAPFAFRRGNRVAWKRSDGTPDHEFIGEIVDGICEFEKDGAGSYRAAYVVKREDGTFFAGGELDLVPVA